VADEWHGRDRLVIAEARLALRLQRFEVIVAVAVAVTVAVSALIVRTRLDGVGVPASCWQAWIGSGFAETVDDCSDRILRFGLINGDEAAKVVAALAVLPFVLGGLLGITLVAREIEGGTAPTVWTLARSRVRWLLGRVVPIVLLLVVLSVLLALASDVLAAVRNPWEPQPNFTDASLHGWVIVPKALAIFGISVLVGALVGRVLPAIVLTLFIGVVLWSAGAIMMTAWLQGEAKQHTFPLSATGNPDESLFPGGTYFATAWLGPAGEILFSQEEAMALAPPGTADPASWVYDNVPQVQMGVPGSLYGTYQLTESLLFGVVALGALIVAFPIVQRRRPM
jgi:hypothetical protein